MANEISLALTLRWAKNGFNLSASTSESYTQVGNAANGTVQTIGATTEQLDFGEITGAKFMLLKSNAVKTAVEIVYVDKVTPVVPASAPIKIGGTQGNFQITTEDVWYAITNSGTVDLSVLVVEV